MNNSKRKFNKKITSSKKLNRNIINIMRNMKIKSLKKIS
jgi:hypothetical protein